MCRVYFYTDEHGSNPVKAHFDELEVAHEQRIRTAIEYLAEVGIAIRRPESDTVHGPVKELRVRVGKVQYRILYFFLSKETAILLHSFVKKTRGIREHDIQVSERRMKDFEERIARGSIKI